MSTDPPIGPIETAGPYRRWSSRQRGFIAGAIRQDLRNHGLVAGLRLDSTAALLAYLKRRQAVDQQRRPGR